MMKKLIAAVLVSALPFAGLTSFAAHADEATGTILSVDPAAGILALEDGTEFMLSDDIQIDGLISGSEVVIQYAPSDNGGLLATEIEVMN
jgi:hypothetical protein